MAKKNITNPIVLILAGALMLDYLGMQEKGDMIRGALKMVIAESKSVTADLRGDASTDEFTNAVINKL